MPVNIRTYQETYDTIKARIQNAFPKSDFTEGSFLDVLAGSFSLAYQELQALISQSFSRTFFSDPATTGAFLDRLALDHFYLGRPEPQKSIGTLNIVRKSGNTEKVDIVKGATFTTGEDPELEYIVTSDTATIAAASSASTSVNVNIEAIQAGADYNLNSNQEWTSDTENITITNSDPIAGGTDALDDEEFRDYIRTFVLSIADGTAAGLEATAELIPGVSDARLLKKLVDVGTLATTGALETNPKRFKSIEMIMYVAGEGVKANSAIIEKVKQRVNAQLSAGEVIDIQPARIRELDVTLSITFTATQNAVRLSTDIEQLTTAIRTYINDLDIGTNFIKSTMETTFAQKNGWKDVSGQDDLISAVSVKVPAGDITNVATDQKFVAGDNILVS